MHKKKIESLVNEMFQNGIIQPSCISFVSLVLLVKKKKMALRGFVLTIDNSMTRL